MFSSTELAIKYLNYAWRASGRRGHGIHSPFVYEFVSEVLNDSRFFYPYAEIEKLRTTLERDLRMPESEDFGAGSSLKNISGKTVADVARRALSTQKFGRLLFRIVNHYQPVNLMELGTSLGISTAYMASANPACSLVSLEGSKSIAQIAAENFKKLGLKNIWQVVGNFDDTLKNLIKQSPPLDLVFLDGNHRKEPVLNYFHQFLEKRSVSSMFIFHDIHWSREMEAAWRMIRDHPEVMVSIDLFSAGFIFFRENFRVKQHFIIRF